VNFAVHHSANEEVFVGDSEMARLMRAHDWDKTPLGPVAQWPTPLKVDIRLLLTSRFEKWLGVEDERVNIVHGGRLDPVVWMKPFFPDDLNQMLSRLLPGHFNAGNMSA